MAGLPEDFDPAWYAHRFPDVGLSGLSPHEHYRRFGSQWGRSANGKGEQGRRPVTQQPEAPARSTHAAEISARSKRMAIADPAPLVDRPADLDLPAPRSLENAEGGRAEPISLRRIGSDALDSALASYARLLRLDLPWSSEGAIATCAASQFQSGPTRIDNAWFAERSRLRLMLSVTPDEAEHGLTLRAYQPGEADPRELVAIDPPLSLPAVGPAFHDIELMRPLMPLILEIANASGRVVMRNLMPFPSLLPGGMHGAELRALQNEANPMEDFWTRSEDLLRQLLDRDRSGSIRSIIQSETPSPIAEDVADWIRAIFDVEICVDKNGSDLNLELPAGCIPTISALVAAQIEFDGSACWTGPYLVAEAESFRPRWAIIPPAGEASAESAPLIGDAGSSIANGSPAPFNSAILFRSPAKFIELPNRTAHSRPLDQPLSIVVDASDQSRISAVVEAIKCAADGTSLEFLLRMGDCSSVMQRELDRQCGFGAWTAIPPTADLREIAPNARHELLLSISDRVRLDDPTVLSALVAMLADRSDAGSASCALVSETVLKGQAVFQPASGGLFPAGVSFATSPRLSFWEPDVLDALPDQTYPVVANTLNFTLFRRDALAALPPASLFAPGSDLRIGLDLIEAGYRNWCTTKVKARLLGRYARRNSIDPLGGAYAQIGRWEDLLPRVAFVRELN